VEEKGGEERADVHKRNLIAVDSAYQHGGAESGLKVANVDFAQHIVAITLKEAALLHAKYYDQVSRFSAKLTGIACGTKDRAQGE
jgi:hypothetical protein